jgi:hypothetical protein
LTIGTFLGGTRSTPRFTAAGLGGLLECCTAKVVTFEITWVGQVDCFTGNLIDIPEWIGRWICQDEVTTWQIDITRLTRWTVHIGTMPPFGFIAPRLTDTRGLGIIRSAKHFISGVSVFGV